MRNMISNKILSKYIHVGSYFKEFIARNTMVQSDFNLDTWFSGYNFFYFKKYCICADVSYFGFSCMQRGVGVHGLRE